MCDSKKEEYNTRVYWGDLNEKFKKITDSAIWIKLKEFPIKKPWMYPQTWDELFEICKAQGIDVLEIVLHMLSINNFSKIDFLFFVFPIPKTFNGVAGTHFWLMCDFPAFG